MKKIFIFTLVLFLNQTGFCNNIPNDIKVSNEKLIEQLSNSDDVNKLAKLIFAGSLLNVKVNYECNEEGLEITEEDLETQTKIINLATVTTKKIVKDNPELENMDSKEKDEILESAVKRVMDHDTFLLAIVECFAAGTFAYKTCGSFTAINEAVFTSCLVLTAVVDISIVTNPTTGLMSVSIIYPTILAETQGCAYIGLGSAAVACVGTVLGATATCIVEAFNA